MCIRDRHNKKFALKENDLVHYISNKDKFEDGKIYIPGEGYHTDHSNDISPPKATILHAKLLPSYGVIPNLLICILYIINYPMI